MVERRLRIVLLALIPLCPVLGGAGCDDAPSAPPDLTESSTSQSSDEPAAPTTQELLAGPRKALALSSLPLMAQVPQSWSIQTLNGSSTTLLEGPSPGGLVQIQLATRPPIAPDKLQVILSRAIKEQTDKPQTVKVLDVKPMPDVPGAQILERQSVGRTMPSVPLNVEGTQLSKPETLYSWTITYFIPQGDAFDPYELNFVGLTAEQFQSGQEVLRKIIDSVTYTGVPATPATSHAGE
jgi:hypothetical protein